MSSYWIKRPKNKYGNKKTKIIFKGEEIEVDSIKEANRAKELELMEKAGEIADLKTQTAFTLQPGFRNKSGRWVKPIIYKADFTYFTADGKEVIEDVKSPATRKDSVYRLKKKMMAYNGYEITEV